VRNRELFGHEPFGITTDEEFTDELTELITRLAIGGLLHASAAAWSGRRGDRRVRTGVWLIRRAFRWGEAGAVKPAPTGIVETIAAAPGPAGNVVALGPAPGPRRAGPASLDHQVIL